MILQQLNQLSSKPVRIVSLVPSQTSLLHYLGLAEETVGITKFCIHPSQWRKEKKIIGGTKNLQLKTIAALNPDLIIANKEENVKEQIEILAKDYPVWVTDVNSFSDALLMIKNIGALTFKTEKADELIDHLQRLKLLLRQQTQSTKKLTVAYFIWKSPWMVAGSNSFINDLITLAGFANYYGNKERYPVVNIEELAQQNLDAIFLSTEPYPFKEKHVAELQQQFPQAKVVLVDGEMFSWYGDHLLKSLPYLQSLHQQLY